MNILTQETLRKLLDEASRTDVTERRQAEILSLLCESATYVVAQKKELHVYWPMTEGFQAHSVGGLTKALLAEVASIRDAMTQKINAQGSREALLQISAVVKFIETLYVQLVQSDPKKLPNLFPAFELACCLSD